MNTTLEPAVWPECWLFKMRAAEVGKEASARCGSHVLFAGGRLVYRCDCGAKFTREPGFLNDETRAWVVEHTPHVGAPDAARSGGSSAP